MAWPNIDARRGAVAVELNPDRVAQLQQFIESSTSNARRIANAVLDDRSARQKLLDEAEAENCEACDDTPVTAGR